MEDTSFGTRNKRGDWTPNGANQVAPLWTLPWKKDEMLAFAKAYFFPWDTLWFSLSVCYWLLFTPDTETLQTLSPSWILLIFLRNSLGVLIFYGAMEYWLYRRRAQGNQFKYNGQFPEDKPSDVFRFRSQTLDGALRTFGTGVPIWTGFEVLLLWSYANGYGPWTTLAVHPLALIVLWLLIPIWHEAHFYVIHRLIHTPFLYRHVHSVHHNSVNPSPWSSLSMHPLEHLLYFSSSLLHLVVWTHPVLVLYQLNRSGMGAIVGHIGFGKMLSADGEKAMDTHAFTHYLHHKYFEVNYGDALIPFDKWFGTWHDGTSEGDATMQARFKAKQARNAS
jgi:sterol desaturase/sphingolipid hydroxylase (fatty acid hydroxylase superfamily)